MPPFDSSRLLTSAVRAHDPAASGTALATRPRAISVAAVCSGRRPLRARHSTGVSGWQPVSDIRSRYSLSSAFCRLPDVASTIIRRSTLGDRAFPVAAARACNTLPPETRAVSSLLTFRRETKSIIFFVSHFADGSLALSLLIDS